MNVLICDDRQEDAERLNGLLRDSGFQVESKVFNNGCDTLDFIHTGVVVDVCFLDIVMPEMSGVALAGQLREDGFTGNIVFLSTSNEYGSEAFSLEAFDYLLKPPTPESVKAIMTKLERARNRTDMAGILVKAAGVVKNILYRDISHAEVINHKVYFRLTDGSEVPVYATFAEIAQELLADPRFIQCHRSFIVNMQDVAEVSENEVIMRGGKRIPIPRAYRETRGAFFKWKF